MTIVTAESGIYKIINLVNDKVYVGSAFNIKGRWSTHIYKLNNGTHENRHLRRAWLKYGPENFKFEILEYCEKERLVEREQYYMDLYNVVETGYNTYPIARSSLGHTVSDSTRKKQALRQLGSKRSEETKRKMSLAALGKPKSEEAKKKTALTRKGWKASKEMREKRSLMRTGYVTPKEVREKISKSNKGRTVSDETRKKISDAKKGHICSEATKKKLSLNRTGRKVSDETRQKMRLAKLGKKKVLPSVII